MARKIDQITTGVGTTRDGYLVRTVVAVCDDGTVWRMTDNEAGTRFWEELPPIPQGPSRHLKEEPK